VSPVGQGSGRDGSAWQPGGGVNPNLVAGRTAGLIEKRHLVFKRHFAERAEELGRTFIDLGTDFSYPFFGGFAPTEAALSALAATVSTARHYPSSYGTTQVRAAVVGFMHRWFDVDLDAGTQVMVSTGASQVFDALTRTYAGRAVVVPDLALSTVTSIAVGNGAQIVRVPVDDDFLPDLPALAAVLRRAGPDGVRFVYINSPQNPTGTVLGRAYLTRLVAVAREHQALIVHDHDSWCTTHIGERAPNILQIPEAIDVAVTVLSVSKELGLPGIRVGLVAGNPTVVNDLRVHNSEFCVMIPQFAQAAAAAALNAAHPDPALWAPVQTRIRAALQTAVAGWQRLGWPADAVNRPQAGYKFLFRPPTAFTTSGGGESLSGAELFDLMLARDAGVKVSTVRSFNPARADWIRMIVMQDAAVIDEAFDRMQAIGVHYDMAVPAGLAAAARAEIADLDLWNL
jgi:aspartate/methionine/tyrosine aminotransferase